MGTVLIHAGMNKTGSTTIQRWIEEHAGDLRALGIEPVLTVGSGDDLAIEPYERGMVKSNGVGQRYFAEPEDHRDLEAAKALRAEALNTGLARAADRFGTVLITSEGFSMLFLREDETYLRSLEQIAQHHEVRVAYYVRPQHTALDSDWRQTGFCYASPPSKVIRLRAQRLDYWRTLEVTRALAPSVDFDVRPFVRSLLPEGDVLRDFVTGFLGMPHTHPVRPPANVGFSLEFVNMLRHAPRGLFFRNGLGGQRLERLKVMAGGIEHDESERGAASRRVLQQWAHERFESDNQLLIRDRGWPIDHLVPPVDEVAPPLEALDTLWEPAAPVGELAVFHQALDQMLRQFDALRRAGCAPASIPAFDR